ncbi:MAG: hypothetical protein M9955_20170 [Rhizobiaceae bacterium]|nr:hypothetical protein [Rhizobiaceae bacterium]
MASLGDYISETEAAGVMEMPVEQFRRVIGQDMRAPKGFSMPGTTEPHYVRAMIANYRDAFRTRFAAH